ncbi:MAG: serine/threonine protein kinase [Alphaproteobacteria bacterium]|nr:serine/threonine protein kinase [Alphaproteobacteria bacterium]
MAWPPAGREAELDRRHGRDPALLAAVRRLIAAETRSDLLPTRPPEPITPFDIAPPERIGAYRLAEEIGRGGMGLVYRGERIEGGFEQTVAIKLMRGSLFSQAAADQFALERRILARLRHPHITQLFDGGLTVDGLSYIVMELVDGLPITDHVEAAGLGLRERLGLFREVCAAVEHAHANGVVHADIKPSNVVVDRGVGVKVLDFGIAALIDADRASRPRAASARYASPQQQAGDPAGAGDDVFALGMLLQDLVPAPDPELAAVAAKAVAPHIADRYHGVGALSRDVERWLARYPVSARPPSAVRSAGLFSRRHPFALSAGALATVALILGLVVTTTLYLRAEARFGQVRTLAVYLLDDLVPALQRAPGTAPLRHSVADSGRAYLEALDAGSSRADIQMEVAQGYARMGEALTQVAGNSVGDIDAGKADLARAEAALRQLVNGPHRTDAAELSLVRTLNARGGVLQNIDNDKAAATRVYAEACRRADDLIRRTPASAPARMLKLDCRLGQANLMDYEGEFAPMPALLEETIAGYRALPPGADPDDVALGLARAYTLLGDARYFLGSPPDALSLYQQSAQVLETAHAQRRDVRMLSPLAYAQFNMSSTLQELKRPKEELATIERGVEVSTLLNAVERSPQATHVDNIVRMQRAVALSHNGRHSEAIAAALASLASRRAAAAARPEDYNAARTVAVGMTPLGDIYLAAGRRREACGAYQEARHTWLALKSRVGLNGFDDGPGLVEIEGKVKGACAA